MELLQCETKTCFENTDMPFLANLMKQTYFFEFHYIEHLKKSLPYWIPRCQYSEIS